MTSNSLRALYSKKIKSSAITEDHAKKLRFKLYTSKKSSELDIVKSGQGFLIPYFDYYGKESEFFRYRYLPEPREKSSLEKLASKKEVRYTQPADTLSEVYLPPLVNWQKVAETPSSPVIITEGELKAASTTAHVMPCIGLGGVWNWKSKRALYSHLPFFDFFDFSGREVYVVFDSDAAHNYKVQQAQTALCLELMRLGAQPLICDLPPLTDVEGGEQKAGLDDLIAEWGGKRVKDYIYQNADYYFDIKELKKLNTEVLYVRDPGIILRYRRRLKMSPRAFVDHAYSDRIYTEESTTNGGEVKTVQRSAPKEWLKWQGRAVVEKFTYAPGKAEFLQDEYNVWPGWGVEPKRGSVRLWRELIDYLFKQCDPKHKKWFEQWLAFPLQNPGIKMYTYVLLWSVVHGVGKSLIGETMNRIYGENGAEIGAEELNTTSNSWAENKQFALGDEIVSEDAKKKATSDRLKKMITQSKIHINIKYVPTFFQNDLINYLLTSNHPNAVYLEDRDRRGFIHEVIGEPKPFAFYQDYREWYLSDEGAGALFYYLLNLDLKGFNPQAPAPVTQSKLGMISASKSDLDQWVSELKQVPDNVLRMNGDVLHLSMMTSEELHYLYDPEQRKRVTVNGISRALKKYGFEQVCNGSPIRLEDGTQKRIWLVRDDDTLAKIKSVKRAADYYTKERKTRRGA